MRIDWIGRFGRAVVIACGALGAAGCFSVPEPPEPKYATREVGADYSKTAIGHWSCPASDIILAKRGNDFVLHELTLDAVAGDAKPIADGRLVFKIGIGDSTFLYAIPQDVTKPAWLIANIVQGGSFTIVYEHPVRSTEHPNELIFSSTIENKTEKVNAVLCPPAPIPRFL